MRMSLTKDELANIVNRTLDDYDGRADSFKAGTWDHDVAQNYDALLRALDESVRSHARILDFGCGPGRDLVWFASHGHAPVGLDGAARFVEMAREASGCEVWHQSFLALNLPAARFDGIFANASLFHVPTQELRRVLGELHQALAPRGVLFCSNPRGPDAEGWNGERYGAYRTYESWKAMVEPVGFEEVEHYYRPKDRPREEQPWLATVWRKK
jgi:SAM-dependent methyltransferase